MQKVFFVVNDPHQFRVFKEYVSCDGFIIDMTAIDTLEIQGCYEDICEVKAKNAFRQLQELQIEFDYVVVESNKIGFPELDMFPGPYIESVSRQSKVLCRMANSTSDRKVVWTTTYTVMGKNMIIPVHFHGEVTGTIREKPFRESDSGWERVLMIDGKIRTYSELDAREKYFFGPKKIAQKKLKEFMEKHLKK